MNATTKNQRSPATKPCKCGGASSGGGSGCSCGSKCGQAGICESQGDAAYIRPIFFAGQLLTAEDLQQQTSYFAAKNRLHNQKLFGDGVVCGLEVACDPCGSATVTVQPGYAIDCCGNDIVVSCPQSVDLVPLINDLRRSMPGGCTDPCPPQPTKPAVPAVPGTPLPAGMVAPVPAGDGEKNEDHTPRPMRYRYCLYINYDEQQGDPVAPYLTDEACGSQQCNWSRVSEGYRLELRCPADSCADTAIGRLLKCLGDLKKLRTAAEFVRRGPDAADLPAHAKRAKETLLDLIEQNPSGTDCTLRKHLLELVEPSDEPRHEVAHSYYASLDVIFYRYIRSCLCAALLPPCAACKDTGVLLACVEVENCAVVSVCNLERKIVLSPAAARYWLPTPLIHCLTEAFCCGTPIRPKDVRRKLEHPAFLTHAAETTAQQAVECIQDELCLQPEDSANLRVVMDAVKRQPIFGEISKQFDVFFGALS